VISVTGREAYLNSIEADASMRRATRAAPRRGPLERFRPRGETGRI